MGDEASLRRSHRNRNISCLFWQFCPAGNTLDKTWPREDAINNRDGGIDLLWNPQSVEMLYCWDYPLDQLLGKSWLWRQSHNFSLCRNALLHPTTCGLWWEILSPTVTLFCCCGGTHPTTHRQPFPCHCLPYEWTLLMCGWLIRQKQYRENVLPSYLDQIMKAQTRSILRAREAQQGCRGGLILTLKHPACSSYIIFSVPAVPLVSFPLLESLCWLPVSFYIKVQFSFHLQGLTWLSWSLLPVSSPMLLGAHSAHLPLLSPAPSIALQQRVCSSSPAVLSPPSTAQPYSPPSCLPSGLIYCSYSPCLNDFHFSYALGKLCPFWLLTLFTILHLWNEEWFRDTQLKPGASKIWTCRNSDCDLSQALPSLIPSCTSQA